MSEKPDHLSDAQAQLLWRRAAELQAEAARRLEERSRLLAPASPDEGSGFDVTEVKAAALEAGISPEFIELAWAEVGAGASGSVPSEAVERRARKFLGYKRSSIEVSRVVDAPPSEVFESMQRVLPSARFALLHVNTLGDDPLRDGVYVFEPPGMWTQAGTAAEFAGKLGSAGIKQIFISLREIGTDKSEVSIRAPIVRGLRANYYGTLTAVGVIGGGGGWLSGAGVAGAVAGLGLAAPVALTAAIVGGVVGAGAIGSATTVGFRYLFQHSLKKAVVALETLLQVVDVGARSKGAFALPGHAEPVPSEGQ